ncbi:hypothetical protein CKS97_20175 [Salmonella enterica subsp. enterica serovar Java]|nr:hypothetical protein [Salmonella enterica subsp. enterica serovar Java]
MRKLNTGDFIQRAREIHGCKYNYDLVVYVGYESKICIICHEHGWFWQTPGNHLHGQGCPKCAVNKRKEKLSKERDIFIKQAKMIHHERYIYMCVDYLNTHSKVCIVCPKHGIFWQSPNKHLSGRCCPKCSNINKANKRRGKVEDFIMKAKKIHGDNYNYSLVSYKNYQTKVCIICTKHGAFWQSPGNHIHLTFPTGCPQCANSGLNPLDPAVVYVLADCKTTPKLIKIGVTNNITQRTQRLKRVTPFPTYKIFQIKFNTGKKAYNLEQTIHHKFQYLNAGLTGFDGCTEWFHYSPEILDYVKIILDGLQIDGL